MPQRSETSEIIRLVEQSQLWCAGLEFLGLLS